MKTSDYIRFKIDRYPKGYVFTYNDFLTEVNSKEAVIKNLNRMVASDKIKKLSKGRFYKSETSVFGELLPDTMQIVKDLLEKDRKIIGYITGLGIYNKLQLTTQVSAVIQIGRNETRPALKRGMYRISFIKQKNPITKDNIPLLQILDAIRYIKKIPDTTDSKSVIRFKSIISGLSNNEKYQLIKLCRKYPPSTRALTGAILELIGMQKISRLKKSLNPITTYSYNISEEVLPNQSNWNIQ